MIRNVKYDDFWLPKDARNIGFLFEYCDKVMKDLYGIEIDVEKFLLAFSNSGVRKKMEIGNPRLLSQSYVDTIECFVTVDCNGDFNQFIANDETENLNFQSLARIWIGKMYTKIGYHFDISLAETMDLVPLWEMSDHFGLGHEISDEAYLDSVRNIFGIMVR